MKKCVPIQELDEAMNRMIRHSEFCERMIAPDGTYPAFGRSVTYRTAAFQSLADVALRKKLPSHVSPAQVRCAQLPYTEICMREIRTSIRMVG